ncbi:protein archease isoform X4 [Pipistrellus kuhlii]|uniref:protein archease isoform X4 n=1 Tax=Pipistrellus kuhlii TaxID=59472 RepID=UPI00174F4DBB|nr:protein archease isoform X4 [Pipistrellus kuhlii]
MEGGSGLSEAAVMAQEEEDIRDYNLNEKQKATKAKYPPVSRKYEYLDHTADVQWGEEFSLSKHPQGTEVKAITYSAMQVYTEEKPEVFVIIDI